MAESTIVWTETASRQRREILIYWTKRNRSTKYSEKLIRLTKNSLNIILANPFTFKSADYPETREAALGYFSIYYKTQDNQLIVMAFWDNRQDPKKLLEMLTGEKQ